jgi:hypothetical protein
MPDYIDAIQNPTEHRGREFKQSALWATLKWKIAKTAMAMANTRDGGLFNQGGALNGAPHRLLIIPAPP